MFAKSIEYEYQHEARICLNTYKFSNIFERFNLNVGAFDGRDFRMVNSAVWMEYNVIYDYNVDK